MLGALTLCLAYAVGTGGAHSEDHAPIEVSPSPPADIPDGAPAASLAEAARFAWRHFIALNWPAVPQTAQRGTRGEPDRARVLGDPSYRGPLVWQTFRSKTELFPGVGKPHGHDKGAETDYGYDDPPRYVFDPRDVGSYPSLPKGEVPACDEETHGSGPLPWVNLSEAHEAGPEDVFAGVVPGEPGHADARVLYAVDVNRPQYFYVAANDWYDGGNPGSNIPADATRSFIESHGTAPPAGTSEYVSFPPGAMEVKSAWRRLTDQEKGSGRFLTAPVRFYVWQDPGRSYDGRPGNPQHACYRDGEMGLIGLHIKLKTPSAPYYVWATFEQADNLLDPDGHPVEDVDGTPLHPQGTAATEPEIRSRNAVSANPQTPDTIQKLFPVVADSVPGKRLYYFNPPNTPTTQGLISVNRRRLAIPEPLIAVNREAQAVLRRYAETHGQPASPWPFYKLVGVQWRPADKPHPGQDLAGDPESPDEVLRYPAIYYTSNAVIETSHRLQVWSGQIQRAIPAPNQATPVNNLITDFSPDGTPVKNVRFGARKPDGQQYGYNMGGCMGCHGQMQATGYGFSFILRRGRINAPEVDEPRRVSIEDLMEGH